MPINTKLQRHCGGFRASVSGDAADAADALDRPGAVGPQGMPANTYLGRCVVSCAVVDSQAVQHLEAGVPSADYRHVGSRLDTNHPRAADANGRGGVVLGRRRS
jgi:hypothetical protein